MELASRTALNTLAKEGWPRHQVNGPVPLEARPGWFVPLPIIGGLNQPPRLRPLRRLRGIFLMGAATPPFPRRGLRLSLQLFSMPPVLPRSIQSCPAGQLHNRKEVGGTKTKNLSAYFLERGVFASKTRANVQTPDPSFARMEYVLVQHSSHTQGNVFPLSRRFD